MAVVAVCKICNGPIGTGEPVKTHDDGLAHYFKTTCEWHREQETAFLKACGIRNTASG